MSDTIFSDASRDSMRESTASTSDIYPQTQTVAATKTPILNAKKKKKKMMMIMMTKMLMKVMIWTRMMEV